jgi:hypothetical protein
MKYSDFKLLTPIEYEEMLTPNIPFNLYYVSKILEATKSPHHKFYLTNIKENPKSIKASEYEIPDNYESKVVCNLLYFHEDEELMDSVPDKRLLNCYYIVKPIQDKQGVYKYKNVENIDSISISVWASLITCYLKPTGVSADTADAFKDFVSNI